MAISTNGTVIARLAGGLYNTVMSNATYLEVASQDPSTLANTLYARDFAKSTDLAVATTLVTNLGLSSVAGLANWVAAQLTAAGAANKGAKIVSLLNDFAGMTADATYGAQATAFNTKVDAALAASQKTGAASGVFADAGTVAVANATFTLTTGVDSGAAFTGGAGNDTFTANNAALGTLDSIDGGAGTNTLNITDSVSIPSLNITAANIQNLNVKSTAGAIGSVAAAATLAGRQEVVYDFAGDSISLGSSGSTKIVNVTVGGVTRVVGTASTAATIADITTALEGLFDAGYGTDIDGDGAGADTDTQVWATYSGNKITVKAVNAGTALPTITFAAGTGGDGVFTQTGTPTAKFLTTVQANTVAAAATTASTFTAPTGVTAVDFNAATDAYVASKTTANTSVTAGGVVKLATAADATVTAGDSVQVSGATGAVVISTGVPTVDLAAVSYTGWTAAPGVFVRNGTTVKITETAGTSTSGQAALGNSTVIQVGANPTSASGTKNSGSDDATRPTSSSTNYPDVVGNLSSAPKGDVTIEVKTPYTDTKGYKAVTYGTGDVTVYMNGGTTASVTGANDVTITDLQSTLLLSSATATAAPGTSKLSTVNVTGLSAVGSDTSVVTIKSDAITNLSIVDSTTTVNVTGNTGANATALNVSVGNSTATVSSGNATSVAVTGVTSAYEASNGNLTTANSGSTLTLTTAKAKTLSFSGASDVTLSSTSPSTLTALTGITSTSTKKVALGDVSGLANLTSIDASGATGALTATIGTTSDYGLTVTGGAGGDTVTLGSSSAAGTISARAVSGGTVKTTVNLGAGNDKFLSGNASSVVDTGAVVDGGDGTDTVQASLITSGNAAIFKNFETVDLVGLADGSLDASLLTSSTISNVALSGALASGATGTYSVTKLAGTAINVTDSKQGADVGKVTAKLATSTGTADTATVTFAATAAGTTSTATMAEFTTTGIESVFVASGGTIATVGHKITNTLTSFVDESNTTASITISGAQKFVLSGVKQSTVNSVTPIADITAALKTIDASAATGGVDITAGADTANVSSTSFDVKFTGLTITGGSGADTIRNDALGGVTNGGDGADTLKVYGGATAAGVQSTANGGAGNDTIIVGAAVSTTLTGGAGRDTFDATAATGSGVVTTITDYSQSEDTIKIDSVTSFVKATTLTGSYADLLTAATTQAEAGSGNKAVWYQFDGNTFVVGDVAGAGAVAVVKLVGLYTLTTLSASSAATGLIGEA